MAKVQDLSDAIYRYLDMPDDTSIPSIAFWLRANIGELNNLINSDYSVDPDTLELIDSKDNEIGYEEGSIYQLLYLVYYYNKKATYSLGVASVNAVVQITADGGTVRMIDRVNLAKVYNDLAKQRQLQLNKVVNLYRYSAAKPIQVVGDDCTTIEYPSYLYGRYLIST